MGEVDLLDILETIREGLLLRDPDLTVGPVHRSFGGAFTVTPRHPLEKEGSR